MEEEVSYSPHSQTSRVNCQAYPGFDDFCEYLVNEAVKTYKEKVMIPMFFPTGFRDRKKSNANAKKVVFAVLDVDGNGFGLSKKGFTDLLDGLEKTRFAFLLYTTSSSLGYKKTPEGETLKCGYKCRVLLPLSRSVTPEEWRLIWSHMYSSFNKCLDPRCKDISRGYYFPAMLKGQDKDYYDSEMFWLGPKVSEGGKVLSVEKLLEGPLSLDFPSLENAHEIVASSSSLKSTSSSVVGGLKGYNCAKSILLDKLRHIAKSRRWKEEERMKAANLLEALKHGSKFASFGSRDETLFEYARTLGAALPEYDSLSIADHFTHSISHMLTGDPEEDFGISVEGFARKIKKQQENKTEYAENQKQKKQKREKKLLKALGKRSKPFSEKEKNQISKAFIDDDVDADIMDKYLVLYQGKESYFLTEEGYVGPYFDNEFVPAAQQELYPFSLDGTISFSKRTGRGDTVEKTKNDLLRDYGYRVRDVYYDLGASASHLDGDSLVLAPCPISEDLEAEYSAEVEEYLLRLCSNKQERVEDLRLWLAAVPEVNRPLAALVLWGKKDTGKSFFANIVSGLWGKAPTALSSVLGSDFQEEMKDSPLLFADEALPQKSSASIRELIQRRDTKINIKHHSPKRMLGSHRLIVAVNNIQRIAFNEFLNKYDVEAIADRFRVLEIPDSMEHWFDDKDRIHRWIEERTFAKHILWLNQQADFSRVRDRFVVPSWGDDVFRYLNVRNPYNSLICHWIISYLEDPQKTGMQSIARVIKGRVLVSSKGIHRFWDRYLEGERRIKPVNIGEILNSLSHSVVGIEEQNIRKPTGDAEFFDIDLKNLYTWAEITRMVSRNDLVNAINKSQRAEEEKFHETEEETEE